MCSLQVQAPCNLVAMAGIALVPGLAFGFWLVSRVAHFPFRQFPELLRITAPTVSSPDEQRAGAALRQLEKCSKSTNVTKSHQKSPKVTKSHQMSPNVTKCHQVSPNVNKSLQMSTKVTRCYQMLVYIIKCLKISTEVTKCHE